MYAPTSALEDWYSDGRGSRAGKERMEKGVKLREQATLEARWSFVAAQVMITRAL